MSNIEVSPPLEPEPFVREAPRPLHLVPELPDGRTRRALVTRLRALGLSIESAEAVGRAVVRPDIASMLVDSPTTYRVPGAELLVVRVEVFTTRVVADATNPRTLNDMLFPAAVAPGDQRVQFPPLEPPKSNGQDFSVEVSGIDQLVWQLDSTMAATIRENTPRPPISEQGVMEPPLAVPARVVDQSGAPLAGVVLVREGSTRVSHAQAVLGVGASDLLRTYVDDRHQRALIAELNAIAQSSASEISDRDAGRLRVATMPIDLVVGVRPDPGNETTLGEAVAAKVAQDHLNHKREWKAAVKEVHVGEQCLISIHDESLITDDEKLWLAGRMAQGSPVDGQQKFEDDRWAELLWLFTTRTRPYSTVIRRPIATVLERDAGRQNVTVRGDRVPLAVALAMRARRGLVTEAAVERESRILESAVPPIIWTSGWRPSDRPIEELAADAIEEAISRLPGNASAELAARAVWYLATHGQLSMPRNDLGAGGDRRPVGELVSGMLASIRGIRQLERSILDGREGNRAARIIDDAGTVDLSGVGTPVELQDDNVRADLVPRSGPATPPPPDPRGLFMDAIARVGGVLQEARRADEDLRSIQDGQGQEMVNVEGVAQAQIDDFLEIVRSLEANFESYAINWRVSERVRTGHEPQVRP